MRLLLDANLSRKLVDRLADIFPGSAHVSKVGLERASDQDLIDYAVQNGFIVVSRTRTCMTWPSSQGPPPKVVWVRLGNCTTAEMESALRAGAERIAEFEADEDAAFLVLGRP